MGFKKGYTPWNKGKKSPHKGHPQSEDTRKKISENNARYWKGKKREPVSESTRKKLSEAQRGEKHYYWKGDKVGYGGLHVWVRSRLGKAKKCIKCGLDKIPVGKKRFFHWSNISGKYKRSLSDWQELCVSCHKKYDLKKITI